MNKKQLERIEILAKTNGNCAYCGCSLEGMRFHIDHFEPVRRDFTYNKEKGRYIQTGTMLNPERDCIENKFASCPSCNIIKSSQSLEGFRMTISGFVKSLNRDSTQYKFAKRYGLVTEAEKPVKFYFETINL